MSSRSTASAVGYRVRGMPRVLVPRPGRKSNSKRSSDPHGCSSARPLTLTAEDETVAAERSFAARGRRHPDAMHGSRAAGATPPRRGIRCRGLERHDAIHRDACVLHAREGRSRRRSATSRRAQRRTTSREERSVREKGRTTGEIRRCSRASRELSRENASSGLTSAAVLGVRNGLGR